MRHLVHRRWVGMSAVIKKSMPGICPTDIASKYSYEYQHRITIVSCRQAKAQQRCLLAHIRRVFRNVFHEKRKVIKFQHDQKIW